MALINKGRIALSQKDVMQALEFWFNEKLLKEPCSVTDVKTINNSQYPYDFEVTVEQPQSKAGTNEQNT